MRVFRIVLGHGGYTAFTLGGIARTKRMKRFIVTLALLGFCIVSASAVAVTGAHHNWTIHVGDRYYGLSGYDATNFPGVSISFDETRLHFGEHAFSLRLHFYWVTGIGLGLLGAAAVTAIVCKLRK